MSTKEMVLIGVALLVAWYLFGKKKLGGLFGTSARPKPVGTTTPQSNQTAAYVQQGLSTASGISSSVFGALGGLFKAGGSGGGGSTISGGGGSGPGTEVDPNTGGEADVYNGVADGPLTQNETIDQTYDAGGSASDFYGIGVEGPATSSGGF